MSKKSIAFTIIDRSIIGFAIATILLTSYQVHELQETIESIKPVDDCAWLYLDGKRGAAIYNRFDGTITIQCKGGDK